MATKKEILNRIETAQIERFGKDEKKEGEADYETSVVVREFFKGLAPGKILDIGCGDGNFLEGFAGWEKHGVEISGLCKKAQERGVNAIRANVEEGLPYKDGEFDAISAQMIIEHLIDTDKFLDECKRALKPGGILVISTCNLASPRVMLRLAVGIQPDIISYSLYDGCRHTRYYTFGSLKSQLEKHGFAVVGRHGGIGFRRALGSLPQGARIGLFGLFPWLGGEIIVKAAKKSG